MKTVSFLRSLIGAAALAAFAGSAAAVPVVLVLDDVSDRNTNQPQDIQCIIYGNSCPGGFQDMAALNYAQGGNQTAFDETSNPNQRGNNDPKAPAPVISDYTVGYLADYVGLVFGIGIDVNTAGGSDPERLVRFEVNVDRLNVAGGFVTEFLFVGPSSLDPAFNGNGYFDFTLNTIDLTSFAAGDLVQFRAVWDQASDGAENFFVYRGDLPPIPEPSTYALMLAGLGVVGYMARRRRQV